MTKDEYRQLADKICAKVGCSPSKVDILPCVSIFDSVYKPYDDYIQIGIAEHPCDATFEYVLLHELGHWAKRNDLGFDRYKEEWCLVDRAKRLEEEVQAHIFAIQHGGKTIESGSRGLQRVITEAKRRCSIES